MSEPAHVYHCNGCNARKEWVLPCERCGCSEFRVAVVVDPPSPAKSQKYFAEFANTPLTG